MNEADFQALAQLLDGFGLAFSLTDAGGTPLLSNHRQRLHDSRVGTLQLADGRRVVLAAPAAPATGTERRRSDLRFQLLAEHSTDLLVAVDDDLRICYASPAAREMLGHAPDALVGRTLNELLAPDDRAAFMSRHFSKSPWRSNLPDMYRAQRADGGTRWVEARVAALPPGNGLGDHLVTLRDVDRRRHEVEEAERLKLSLSALAATDALTGLPNRRQFDETLHKEWNRALRDGQPLALLMVDVDRFKSLNDLFGHQVGDAILAHVGKLIRHAVRRAGDLPARYGGEEFGVVLPGTAAHGALEIAEVIRRAVANAPTDAIIEGGYPVSVSIGVAAAVPHGDDSAAALLHNADAALYQAKKNGRNRVEVLA